MTIEKTLLVIEDEPAILTFLRSSLEEHGWEVMEARTAGIGLDLAAKKKPDAILLDLGLPDKDGIAALKELRKWTSSPVIIISARGQENDKISGLDAGADDYLTKPFSTEELLARMRVAQRHAQPQEQEAIFTVGNVQVDFARRLVTRNGEPVKLTPTEYALLRLLIQHAGRVLTHRQILKEVWGPEYVDELHYLRVYFAQLRQKLEDDPTLPKLILTEPGVGYRLQT